MILPARPAHGRCAPQVPRGRVSSARPALLAALLAASMPASGAPLLLDLLDVGQGDAMVLRHEGRTVLVDAGQSPSVILPQLQALGVHQLDLVVASHAHADHIGALDEVLSELRVSYYMDNRLPHTTRTFQNVIDAVRTRGITYLPATPGRRVELSDEAVLTVLAPPQVHFEDTRSDHNSNSVVLWLQHGEVDMLLTGDIEAPSEAWLVSQGLPDDIEVLKVPHHGSNHSSTEAFLDAVAPDVALVSCGADNRYGHPGEETLARLHARNVLVFRTDRSGNVRVLSDGERVEVFEGSLRELGPSWPLDHGLSEVAP